MPIDVKKLLSIGVWGKDSRERVRNYLRKNWKKAFTSKELSEILNINKNTLSSALRFLRKRGEVEKVKVGKTFYYFYKFRKNRRKK